MPDTTREYPTCPEVPVSGFLLALAESRLRAWPPPGVAAALRDLAAMRL